MHTLPLYERTPTCAIEHVDPAQRDAACELCKLGARRNLSTRCMPVVGEPGGLLIVGDSPCDADDQQGRPFMGRAGVELRRVLEKRWSGPVALTYAVGCAPGKNKVTPAIVRTCRQYLANVVRDVQPERVILLGGTAALAFLGRSVPPAMARGAYSFMGDGTPVFVVLSPLVALRNRFVRRWFAEDFEKALTIDPVLPPMRGKALLVDDEDDARAAIAELYASKVRVMFDVETAGTLFGDDLRLLCVSFAPIGSDSAYVFTRQSLGRKQVRVALHDYLVDPFAMLGGQNAKYDRLAVLCALGADMPALSSDTRLIRKLLEPEADARLERMVELVGMGGMKEAAQVELKERVRAARKVVTTCEKLIGSQPKIPAKATPAMRMKRIKGHESKVAGVAMAYTRLDPFVLQSIRRDYEDERFGYYMLSDDTLHRYNALDAVGTARLDVRFTAELTAEPALLSTWRRTVSPANLAFSKLEQWGIAVSRVAVAEFDRYLAPQEEAARAILAECAPGVNWASTKQVADYLYGTLGLPCSKETKGGGDSTDADALEPLRGKHPVVDQLLALRSVTKLRTTYAEGIRREIRPDSRIHCDYKLAGARTGRPSAQNPNMLNVPRAKDSIEGKMLRDCFVAPPGKLLVELDECLVPGTRLLTADLRWVRVEDVRKGDELVGFDEKLDGRNTKYRGAIVERVRRLRKPCYRIVTTRGAVVASALHGWVAKPARGHQTRRWMLTHELTAGCRVSMLAEPWDTDTSWGGGCLAGFLDGEGWCGGNGKGSVATGWAQKPGPTFDYVMGLMRDRGIDFSVRENTRTGVLGACTCGAFSGLRMVGMLRPTRLLPKSRSLWEGRTTWGKRSTPALVLSVEYVGECDVIATQTSTRTLIAEGMLSHNSQVELRVAAALSGDPLMRQIFLSGEDYHMRTAQLVAWEAWGLRPEQVESKHRTMAKTINFAVLYGAGVNRIAATLGITKKAAARIMDAIMGKFTRLKQYGEEQLEYAQKHGVIWTQWDGQPARRRPMWQIADTNDNVRITAENGSLNTPVQGSASDICIMSLVELVRWIEDEGLIDAVKIVLTVYDSIMFECDAGMVDEVVHVGRQIMEQWPLNGVPLLADAKVGPSWGSLVNYNEWKGEA